MILEQASADRDLAVPGTGTGHSWDALLAREVSSICLAVMMPICIQALGSQQEDVSPHLAPVRPLWPRRMCLCMLQSLGSLKSDLHYY